MRFSAPARLLVTVFAIDLCLVVGCATRRMDYAKGAARVCEVHHREMEKTIVPIHYGLGIVTPRNEAMYSASTNGFPHAPDSVNPGCAVQSPREAVIYICPECVKLRQQWEADYDSKH